MKHVVMAVRAGMPPEPQVVAELGPGDGSVAQRLRNGARFSHPLDLTRMGLSGAWNGHHACPEPLWTMIVGPRLRQLRHDGLPRERRCIHSGTKVIGPPATRKWGASPFNHPRSEGSAG